MCRESGSYLAGVFQRLRAFLAPPLPDLSELTTRLTRLETDVRALRTEELERDLAIASTLDQLKRYLKRIRSREAAEESSEEITPGWG